MTDLEKDLRQVLEKYNMYIYGIHILFGTNGKNILEILFEDEEVNERNIGRKIKTGNVYAAKRIINE